MRTYVILFRFTQQGVKEVTESAGKIQQAKEVYAKMGAAVKQVYALMGQYDFIFIVEAPDDSAVVMGTTLVASKGFFGGETYRAFTEVEIQELADQMMK